MARSAFGFTTLLLWLFAIGCGGGAKSDRGATGTIPVAGGEVRVADAKSNLDRARIVVPAGALAAPLEVSISRGEPVIPSGTIALSVPVTFRAAITRLSAEARFEIPVDFSKMPAGARLGRIDVFRLRAGSREPFAPPFFNLRARPERGVVEFFAEDLTTYQAAIRPDAGRPFQRKYTYRVIAGISAGANGAAAIGFRNHQMFDVIAALGGYIDWPYMLHYMEKYFLGGFCKVGGNCRVGQDYPGKPPPELALQPTQDFNNWIPNDNGGDFNRTDFVQFFQDFSFGFGNPVSYNPASTYLPLGVPPSYLSMSDEARCAGPSPVVLSGMCDAEYNPDGVFPVIPLCDGEDGNPPGVFDPTKPHTKPAEVLLAVDVNGNGVRDFAEPIPFNARERFDDVGADGKPDAEETGPDGPYDAVRNPDPAGDNYHWFYNPGGTEGNWMWDPGEPYRDYGLDGVAAHGVCAADYGEGNGRYDLSPNVERYLEHSPRTWLARMAPADLARLRVWIDGGIRDFAGSALSSQQVVGALAGAGLNARAYHDFQSLVDDPGDFFDFTRIDTTKLGRNVFLRYGKLDATAQEIEDGDGKHVGTPYQAVNRFLVLFKFIDDALPGGDRTPTRFEFATNARNEVFFSPSVAVCRDPGSRACYAPSSRAKCNEDEDCAPGACIFGSCRSLPPGSRRPCGGAAGAACPQGEICMYGICTSRAVACATDSDCADGTVCEERSCAEDSHCEAGERCVYGVCRKASGSAAKCTRNADCPGGQICFGERTYLVVLPPGYDDPAYANVRYPVVYILHGYGQEPRDLAATVVLTANYMSTGTLQKMIFVYPDGKCYLGECRRANWYVDQPPDEGGQVRFGYESSVKDLIRHVDERFRTKREEVREDRP